MINCVVCGAKNDGSHKCDKETENRIEGRYSAKEKTENRPPMFGSRLGYGFWLMQGYKE